MGLLIYRVPGAGRFWPNTGAVLNDPEHLARNWAGGWKREQFVLHLRTHLVLLNLDLREFFHRRVSLLQREAMNIRASQSFPWSQLKYEHHMYQSGQKKGSPSGRTTPYIYLTNRTSVVRTPFLPGPGSVDVVWPSKRGAKTENLPPLSSELRGVFGSGFRPLFSGRHTGKTRVSSRGNAHSWRNIFVYEWNNL